jgi:hypothetical protein
MANACSFYNKGYFHGPERLRELGFAKAKVFFLDIIISGMSI